MNTWYGVLQKLEMYNFEYCPGQGFQFPFYTESPKFHNWQKVILAMWLNAGLFNDASQIHKSYTYSLGWLNDSEYQICKYTTRNEAAVNYFKVFLLLNI